MKQLIKNRKILLTTLSLAIICIFTLTVAYSALNAVLTIQGNAEVVASTWDIHLENAEVEGGSATTDVPTITSGRTLTFNTTLNMPGDYYEFTVDVVNAGSIDAMIEKVTMIPELSTEQAKYLKYEVSYENGESINAKQNIAAGVTMPLKVRIEYRSDLSNDDLPTGQVVLNLSLVLDYIQSDGSGSNVVDNGKNLIAFTVDGDTFYAEEGMTWWEWKNSEYNIDGVIYYATQLQSMYSSKYGRLMAPEGIAVYPDRIIKDGEAYTGV